MRLILAKNVRLILAKNVRLILASFWHWAYWDLDLFFTSTLTLDLNQILSIHLTLASSLCLGFGLAHLTGFLGPGMWTSDSLNLVGSIRFVKASFNLLAYARLAYGVISSHHTRTLRSY